ncbi:TPA: acyltransferase family protein [Vibrio cholerae]
MNKRFEALDAFRGLCAIAVVIFHMHIVSSISELDFFRGSSIFVEFFFVLSGFVLAHGYGFKISLGFKDFIKSRFFRLYPLHLFMFVVFVILEFLKLCAYKYFGITFNSAPFSESTAVSEMIPNLLLMQAWLPFTNSMSFNYTSWSISIEFYLYIILFISIMLFKSNRIISWLLISILSLSLFFLDLNILTDKAQSGLFCFFGGAFVYSIYRKISHCSLPYILGSVIEFFLLILIVLVVESNFELRDILAPIVFFFVILFFAFEFGFFSSILKFKFLQYIGKLSYSIYMTHAALIFCLISFAIILQKLTGAEIAPMLEGERVLNFGNELLNNGVVIIVLFLVICISSFTYKYIEIPGQKLKNIL